MTSAISPRSAAVGVGPDSPGTFSDGGGVLLGDVMAPGSSLHRAAEASACHSERSTRAAHVESRHDTMRPYSDLNAIIGSTLDARRAGIQLATNATTMSVSVATPNATGSVTPMP